MIGTPYFSYTFPIQLVSHVEITNSKSSEIIAFYSRIWIYIYRILARYSYLSSHKVDINTVAV